MKNLYVQLSSKVFQPKHHIIRVQSRSGLVRMLIDDRVVELTTATAHNMGFHLVSLAAQALQRDHICVVINNETIDILPEYATQIGGALLRKADAADDWQLQNLKPKRVLP